MLGLGFFIDAQPRSKNGQPPHITTGVASSNSIQPIARTDNQCCNGCPGIRSDIPRNRTGIVSATLIQKRRDIESSSGFVSSSTTERGSSAIPQVGHAPGSVRTTCGCIGQV